MRRVALLTHGYETGGGVPTVARWLAGALTQTGRYAVDVHDLATSSRDPNSRRIAVPASWTRRSLRATGSAGTHARWGANLVEVEPMRYRPRRELTAVLREYDIVQVVSGGPAWCGVTRDVPVPVVLQVATLAAWERSSQLAAQPLPAKAWRRSMTAMTSAVERVALRSADAVMVENRHMLEHIRSRYPTPVYLAPPGVDTEAFAPRPEGWHRQGHLLSVCRHGDPRKGLERMLHAYAAMVRAEPSVPPLILVGRGSPSWAVSTLIHDLRLHTRVFVQSDLSRDDLVEAYRGASVFLQTSYEEGLGVSVLEAMSCGLPVVATATAGTRETIVNGVTGWLVDVEPDRVAFTVARQTLEVLAGEGSALGRRGRQRCLDHFSTTAALKRFTTIYDELLRH